MSARVLSPVQIEQEGAVVIIGQITREWGYTDIQSSESGLTDIIVVKVG